MSGPAVHHIIAKEFLHKVLMKEYPDPSSRKFWDKMDKGGYAPVYHLGCQGPDFLFFNMNDWPLGGVIKPIAETYMEVMDFIEEFKEQLKALIPDEIWALISTLENIADDAVEASALLSEISELISIIQNNIGALKSLVETKIEELVTDAVDLFSLLKHPQQDGQDFKEWWWFDTLHIRRSGNFLKQLLSNSGNYSMERAYALGYLTHYATDTVGHAYVNAMAGGPYRSHAQRHKVIENHQDVWAYRHYLAEEFVQSNLAEKYIINGDITKLPVQLKDFILKCVENTYFDKGESLYGRKMDGSDLDIAYKLWLKWFTAATNDTDLPAPKPYSLTGEIAQAWDKFTNNVGNIGNMIGNAASGSGGILSFFAFLAALIAGAVLLAAALVDFIAGEIATIGAAPLRFFLSLTYEELYNAYMNFRQGLVMNGFAFPYQSGLNHYMTQHMTNTGLTDLFGHHANSLPQAHAYPARKYKKPGMEAESHLIYPWPDAKNQEISRCSGFPSSYFKKDPEWYMTNDQHKFSKSRYDYYKKFTESDLANAAAAEIESNFTNLYEITRSNGLGNAVVFSQQLYAEFAKLQDKAEFIDFNLDSDRGYAFKSWRKVKDISLVNSSVNDYTITNVAVETDGNVENKVTDILYPNGGVQ